MRPLTPTIAPYVVVLFMPQKLLALFFVTVIHDEWINAFVCFISSSEFEQWNDNPHVVGVAGSLLAHNAG